MVMPNHEAIYLIDTGDEIVWCDDPTPSPGMSKKDAIPYVREDVVEKQRLSDKHKGMKVSCSGLLVRLANGSKIRQDQRWMLGEMYKHLEEMGKRFYAGDIKAVDEFLQLYCLDGDRPA